MIVLIEPPYNFILDKIDIVYTTITNNSNSCNISCNITTILTTIIIYDMSYIIYDKYYQFIILLYLYTCKYAVSTATKFVLTLTPSFCEQYII